MEVEYGGCAYQYISYSHPKVNKNKCIKHLLQIAEQMLKTNSDKLYPIQRRCAQRYKAFQASHRNVGEEVSVFIKPNEGYTSKAGIGFIYQKSPTFNILGLLAVPATAPLSGVQREEPPRASTLLPCNRGGDARCKFGILQHFVWQHKCYVFSWTEPVICSTARFHHLLILGT